MGDIIVNAAHEIWDIVMRGVADPRPWLIAGLVVVSVFAAGFARGKLLSMWTLIPLILAAGYWAWHVFGR